VTENNRTLNKEKIVNLFFYIGIYLFLFGGFGGLVAHSFFSKDWISIVSFISFLPMINVWIWQWLENKKGKTFANKGIVLTVTISILSIIYVLYMGRLGKIPIVLTFLGVGLYFGWIAWSFIIAVDEWWKKTLIVFLFVVAFFVIMFFRKEVVKVECNRVSDIVYMDIFENLSPPIVKKGLTAKIGVPNDISVDYEKDDDYRYKIEVWEYARNIGGMNIIFIDDDYSDGYVEIYPTNLYTIEFFKDISILKKDPKKKYTIALEAGNNQKMGIDILKDNRIKYIIYSSEQ